MRRRNAIPALVLAYLGSALTVAIAALVATAISSIVVLPHVTVLMLAAVLFSAICWGMGPSLFAAFSSIAVSSFFFMPPIYSFAVHRPQDLVDLCVFSLVALLTGHLAARVRRQAIEARQREARMRELYSLSGTLVGLLDVEGLLHAMVGHFCAVLRRPVLLLMPRGKDLRVIPPDAQLLDEDTRDAAERFWIGNLETGARESMLPAGDWNLHLLACSRGPLGLMAIAQPPGRLNEADEEPVDLDAMLEHATTILERVVGSIGGPQPRPHEG